MTTTLCNSGAALLKAGANVNAAFTGTSAEANWTKLINQAEGVIGASTRRDWVTDYSGLTLSGMKLILEDCCSSLAAIYAIEYDMSGYTSLSEASTMCDILRDRVVNDIEILKEQKNQEKII